jgi:hypothetical protein
MRIENRIPRTYIISETKINEDTFDSALRDLGFPKYTKEWKEKNKGVRISDVEKIPEFLVKAIVKSEHKLNNAEACLGLVANESIFLKYSEATVFFKDISYNAATSISSDNIKSYEMVKSGIDKEKISFWVPGSIEKSKAAMIDFGLTFEDVQKRINIIIEEFEKRNASDEEMAMVKQKALDLLPRAVQIDAIINASMSEWREMLLRYTQPGRDDELRYIYLHLFRDMKRRYPSLLQDLVLQNITNREIFGADTLDAQETIWQDFRVVKQHT